jgi:hypothetical protein
MGAQSIRSVCRKLTKRYDTCPPKRPQSAGANLESHDCSLNGVCCDEPLRNRVVQVFRDDIAQLKFWELERCGGGRDKGRRGPLSDLPRLSRSWRAGPRGTAWRQVRSRGGGGMACFCRGRGRRVPASGLRVPKREHFASGLPRISGIAPLVTSLKSLGWQRTRQPRFEQLPCFRRN